MKAYLRTTFLFTFFCFSSILAFTQVSSRFELGLTGGIFVYRGDLTPSALGSYRTMRATVNLFANYNLNQAFALRTSLFYGSLSGNDAAYRLPEWRQHRSLRFQTSTLELSQLLLWNAWTTEKKMNTYLFGGLGLSLVNVNRDASAFDAAYFSNEHLGTRLAEDLAHQTPVILPVVPVGAGVRVWVSKNLSLVGETMFRFTRSDYIDGFSQAGNPAMVDHYQSHTIGLLLSFGKKSSMDCPVIVQ